MTGTDLQKTVGLSISLKEFQSMNLIKILKYEDRITGKKISYLSFRGVVNKSVMYFLRDSTDSS